MLKVIVRYGLIAGAIAAIPWIWLLARLPANAGLESMYGYARSYLIMLVALSMVFLGIKHHRDRNLGGFITFGKGFLLGLGISTVASILYVIGWEIASAISDFDFAKAWNDSMLAAARARGAAPAEMERVTAEAAEFSRNWANPLIRLPMVFIEIFPVGILVSLISAGILRKRAPAATTPDRIV